jgi:dolichol kinase
MQEVALIDATLANQLNQMMAELHELVSKLQLPRLKGDTWRKQAIERCQLLAARITEIIEQLKEMSIAIENDLSERWQNLRERYAHTWESQRGALHNALEKVAERLSVYSAELDKRPNGRKLKAVYGTLSAGYEELVDEITELRRIGLITSARASHLKPMNYARNVFHAMMGISSAIMYGLLISRETALIIVISIFSTFASLEITRRIWPKWNDFLVDKVFGIIARPHERKQTNGSTYYVAALILILLLFPKPVCLMAVLVLGLADPAASVAGKLWGKKKIVNGKSYVGSLTFLVVAFAVALPFSMSMHSFLAAIPIALVVAFTTMLAELLITKIDDNFTIPVVCASVAWMFI